jgi:hypothetical protein
MKFFYSMLSAFWIANIRVRILLCRGLLVMWNKAECFWTMLRDVALFNHRWLRNFLLFYWNIVYSVQWKKYLNVDGSGNSGIEIKQNIGVETYQWDQYNGWIIVNLVLWEGNVMPILGWQAMIHNLPLTSEISCSQTTIKFMDLL